VGWDPFWHDLRYAACGIRRHPGFTVVVVATLSLGIGANAITFGMVDRLLLRPPPGVVEPDRVTRIYFRERAGAWLPGRDYTVSAVTSYPILAALRESVSSLEEVAGFYCAPFTVGRAADAEEPDVCLVTGNLFRLLGAQPALGRFFTADEDRPPVGSPVAVLGHGYWQRRFGGADDVVGRQLLIENQLFTVIGVAPPWFSGVSLQKVDVWVPVSSAASTRFGRDWHSSPNAFWIQSIGRLATGATRANVEAEATAVFRRTVESGLATMGRDPLGQVLAGSLIAARGPEGMPQAARISLWLLGVSATVLLIACANVVNLLLVRASQRGRETAVRLALGISRARLGRQLLTEALLLALLAAAGAFLLTHHGTRAIRSVLLPDISWGESPADVRVLAFTLTVTLLAGLLAGIVPAIQAGATDLTSSLKAGAPQGGQPRLRLRTGLLVVQAAFSVVLLVGAGLFVRSLAQVRALDVGIDLDRVFLARMDLRRVGMPPQRVEELFHTAHDRVRRLSGVERATLVGASIPKRSAQATGFLLPGHESIPALPGGGPYYSAVDSDYFGTLGTKVVRGRAFAEPDEAKGARVAVVNQTMARHLWPGQDPIGQCLLLPETGQPCTEVVGVVQNVVLFSVMDERALYYLPLTHPAVAKSAPDALLVRAARGFPRLGGTVRGEIQSLAPDMPYVSVQSYEELVAPELQPWRLGATMFTVFGGLALVIAAVGLYSAVAYLVTQRTHEIGVRMALGAETADVVRIVVGDAAGVVAAGLSLGFAVALAAGHWIQPLLYQTSAHDPAVFAAVAAALAGAALAASLIPAWRASRVDPAVALRAE
jgi:predicted permease